MEIQLPSRKTIGVIGLGSIGMRHAKNLLAMGHEVLGQDTDLKRQYELMQAGGSILQGRAVDGIVVASPTKFHLFHWANTAAPVLIEKPIAQIEDVGIVREELVAREGEITMVGNNLRFHSCVKKAKEWLTQGLIGKPLWASFCVAQHNTKYADPVVLNWGAHEIDLALYLLGPAMVTAATGNDQIFDMCLLHEYGVPSTVHMDYVTRPERRSFMIAGERALISVDLVARSAILTDGTGDVSSEVFRGQDSFDSNYVEEMQAFIDLIDGKPVHHAATGADGLACLELILEAQRMANK